MISISGLAQAASDSKGDRGRSRRSPRAFGPIAAGSTPAAGAIDLSSPSLAKTV